MESQPKFGIELSFQMSGFIDINHYLKVYDKCMSVKVFKGTNKLILRLKTCLWIYIIFVL